MKLQLVHTSENNLLISDLFLEEAIRLKEKKIASEIIAVTVGPKLSVETLRTALAMGADKGIHVTTSDNERTDQSIQPLAVAKVLKFIADVRLIIYSKITFIYCIA